MTCKLTGLSSLEALDWSATTYMTIMFSDRNCLSPILVYLKIVIKIMAIESHTVSASVFHEIESILDIISLVIRCHSCNRGHDLNDIS